MRTGVTLVDITRAADQLLADGERPTVEGIRKFLGTGSPATVNTLLKQYYQTLPARLNLPAPIATVAAELYEKLRATATEEVTALCGDLEAQIAAQRERLNQERREFETEKAELRAEVASRGANVERLQDQVRQLTARTTQLEKDLAGQAARASSAEAQARAADEERDRTHQKHTAEIQRLREQSEGNERHLLLRIDEQKIQQQRLQVDREREAAAAAKRIGALEAAQSEALKAQASLRAEVGAAQRDLAKRGEALATAESSLQRLKDEGARDEASFRGQLEQVQARHEHLEKAAEQLRRERDNALRDAALLEGKAAAFQAQLEGARIELARLHQQAPRVSPAADS
jgi:chromosome segregation ATPase